MKAKTVSMGAIIFSSILVLVLMVVRGLFPLWAAREFGLTAKEIFSLGGFLILAWSPIFLSVYLDKFIEMGVSFLEGKLKGKGEA